MLAVDYEKFVNDGSRQRAYLLPLQVSGVVHGDARVREVGGLSVARVVPRLKRAPVCMYISARALFRNNVSQVESTVIPSSDKTSVQVEN